MITAVDSLGLLRKPGHDVLIALALLLFVFSVVCSFWGALLCLELIDEVNQYLPDDKKFGFSSFYYAKAIQSHKMLFPESALRRRQTILLRYALASWLGVFLILAYLGFF